MRNAFSDLQLYSQHRQKSNYTFCYVHLCIHVYVFYCVWVQTPMTHKKATLLYSKAIRYVYMTYKLIADNGLTYILYPASVL